MNEQLQQELAAWLARLRDASDFAIEQAPHVVQEYVRLGRVQSLLSILVSVAVVVACVRIGARCRRAESEAAIAGGVTCIILGACAVVYVIPAAAWALEAWCAPRVYVLNWLLAATGGR